MPHGLLPFVCLLVLSGSVFGPVGAQSDVRATLPPVFRPADINLFGFVTPEASWPCNLGPLYSRGLEHFWYTRLAEAGVTFDSLQLALQACDGVTSPVYEAQVLLALARVEQRQFRPAPAMDLTLQATDLIDERTAPALLAEALILDALLQEVAEQAPEALEAIARAGKLVRTHDLKDARSTYYLRASSINRFYGDKALAARLADSALVAARDNGRIRDQTDAIFLGATLRGGGSLQKISAFRMAADLYRRAGTADGYASMLRSIAREHYKVGNYNTALSVLDSAFAAMSVAKREGYATQLSEGSTYELYAEIYRGQGRLDSAYANLARARTIELEYAYGNRNSEVLRLQQANERARAEVRLETERSIAVAERRGKQNFAWSTAILTVVTGGLTGLVVLLSRARRRIRLEVARQTTLRDELHHRVKNNFQILISFLELQAEQSTSVDVETAFTAMAQRVYNLAAIHALLYDESIDKLPTLERYVQHLVDNFAGLSAKPAQLLIRTEIDEMTLSGNQFMAFGIIVNELLTNSAKYATSKSSVSPITVDISIHKVAESIVLNYKDNGLNTTSPEQHQLAQPNSGLGTYLINSMVRQLRGRQSVTRVPGVGYHTTVTIPFSNLKSPT